MKNTLLLLVVVDGQFASAAVSSEDYIGSGPRK